MSAPLALDIDELTSDRLSPSMRQQANIDRASDSDLFAAVTSEAILVPLLTCDFDDFV